MNSNNPFLARFSGEPALVSHEKQGWFETCLSEISTHADAHHEVMSTLAAADEFWPAADDRWGNMLRPYVVRDGVLQVPVKGVLLHDFPYALGSWATGYDYIAQAVKRGLADPEVKGIALMVDSPGGMLAGCFDLVDRIYAARGQKPIQAFAHEHAYSAAYAVASAADSITVSATGGVGSIGVVTMHVDVSERVAADGVKITFIFAGSHKVDGNPYEPLPASVRKRIQARIDQGYDVFVASVARNRNMDEKAVRETEAQTFMAHEATSNGLADAIGTREDSLAAFVAFLSIPEDGDEAMADTQAEKTTAPDEAALSAARAEGSKAGASAERARITAILASDAGKARPKAALSAALKTDMTVEQASAFLADLSEEKAEASAPVDPLAAAMAKGGNPDIGAGTDEGTRDPEMSVADRIVFNATGKKPQRARA